MAYFRDADELYHYVGGAFRAAGEHPTVGADLARAGFVLQLYYSEPEASLTVRLEDPIVVVEGGDAPDADVVLRMPADIADRFWRGEYNLAVGLSRGKVKARGPVEQLLGLIPSTKPLFPMYRTMVAVKDAPAGVR
jgi:hypothetical protein